MPSSPGSVGLARAHPLAKTQAMEPSRQTLSSDGPPYPLGRWSSGFIDLQKAYDSVARELLRVVLARLGAPEKSLPLSASSVKACELACVRMIMSTRSGLTSLRGCGKDVCCHRLFSISSSLL